MPRLTDFGEKLLSAIQLDHFLILATLIIL